MEMNFSNQMGRLSPERRFHLYNRIAEVLREAGALDAAEAAQSEAAQAVKESPKLQTEMKRYINALKDEGDRTSHE